MAREAQGGSRVWPPPGTSVFVPGPHRKKERARGFPPVPPAWGCLGEGSQHWEVLRECQVHVMCLAPEHEAEATVAMLLWANGGYFPKAAAIEAQGSVCHLGTAGGMKLCSVWDGMTREHIMWQWEL